MGLILNVLLAAGIGSAAAARDPALCPFELGYNPIFNGDGSVLSCQKDSETFEVDSPNGVIARSLRGIGTSLLSIQTAALKFDVVTVDSFLDPNVLFFLQDGVPRGIFNPVVDAFFLSSGVFLYAPGVDPSSLFDVTAYQFLGGTPTAASVHVKLTTMTSFVNFDSIWLFNDVGDPAGRKRWQLFRANNLLITPLS